MDSTLIYDVGMHKGEDTDYYLKLGFRVVGFEADPELIATCKSRFAAPVASGQLHIVEGAIAPLGYGEEITFFRSSLSVWGTVEHEWEERNRRLGAGSTPIKVKRVDVTHCVQGIWNPLLCQNRRRRRGPFDSRGSTIVSQASPFLIYRIGESFVCPGCSG